MKQQDYIEKLHGEILTIMDTIHKICEANNLRYYLYSGSLLGSIRHKDFIPWDDDLDILMPRKDFDTFMSIAPNLLAPNYELFWYTTKPKYWKLFAKVSKKNTLFLESTEMPTDMQWGIFVDIFPLDETPAYSSKHREIQERIHQLGSLLELKSERPNSFARFIKKVISLFLTRSYIHKKIYELSTSLSAKGNNYYCTFASTYDIKKGVSPAEWYGIPKLSPFRDRFYYISTEAEKILEDQFGENYMELPPIEKRRTHYPVKVLFSDGEVLEFEKPKIRLTVKTQG